MAKETGKVGRGGSRGSAQVGACFILDFSVQTLGLFPQDGVDQAFSWTEGLGPGFEIGLSLLFEMGGSCTGANCTANRGCVPREVPSGKRLRVGRSGAGHQLL